MKASTASVAAVFDRPVFVVIAVMNSALVMCHLLFSLMLDVDW
jgi:hypothetical protein